MYKLFFLGIFFVACNFAMARGIIMADDHKIITTFRDGNRETMTNLVNSISQKYDKVILHLGSGNSFTRGNQFFYKTSKDNLSIFSSLLAEKNIKFYLWVYDSFGAAQFEKVYFNYKEVYYENKKWLDSLNIQYDGIVIDLEWINNPAGNNNEKFIEILQFLKENENGKSIYFFASLHEDSSENIRRGYTESEVLKVADNIMPMLYLKDGGFYLEDDMVYPYLNDNRTKSLLNYFQEKGYEIVTSLDRGIIYVATDPIFIRSLKYDENFGEILNYEVIDEIKAEFYTMQKIKVTGDSRVQRDDGAYQQFHKNDVLYLFESKEKILDYADYEWEYFLLN